MKTINKRYVVKVNKEPVYFSESKKEAEAYIAKMIINDSIENVSIVKEIITESVISSLTPQITKVLVVNNLTEEI